MEKDCQKKGSLHSPMGRPACGALGSLELCVVGRIRKLRQKHEGWGADPILDDLKKDKRFADKKLPKPSSIALFLKQEGLTAIYEPHSSLPVPPCLIPKHAHDLWQIDGQGNSEVPGVGTVAMLNIKDVFSHKYISAFPARLEKPTSHPATRHYQTALRQGFIESGRPKKAQADHASVFYDNKSKSPFPTKLHLWLISLDIELCFSRVHRPTDQGQAERPHQTIDRQALKGQSFRDWGHLFDFAQHRRDKLNFDLPCRTLNRRPPMEVFPEAIHSGRGYRPESEGQLMGLNKVWAFLEKGKWFRILSRARTLSLGGQVYYLSTAKPKTQLDITFSKKGNLLIFRDGKGLVVGQVPIKGISKKNLMGDFFNYFSFVKYYAN